MGEEGNLRKNKYMCERLMVRLEEKGRAGGEACCETPPAFFGCQAPPSVPCPASFLAVFPRSEPGMWESLGSRPALSGW